MLERVRDLAAPAPSVLPLLLVPRRRARANNSVAHPTDPDREALLLVHPDDAAAAGVAAGEVAQLRNGRGDAVIVTVHVDANVRRGVASMTHGVTDASPGALISAHDDVDRLTSMPMASGVPVTLARVDE
jgi:anaerobic selenocysteine-containing dehydrogenase